MTSDERILVTRHSAYNTVIVTEDSCGLRTLRFGEDGVCQSVVKLGDPQFLELPYANILPVCLAFAPVPKRMLIIGLGGGTLPSFFRSLLPEMEIDVVEIDEVVVDVAKTYCGFREDAKMRVHIEDGRDFVDNCEQHFDIVVLDSFDAQAIPHQLATAEFFQSVRKALSSEGVVVANVWGRTLNRLYDRMLVTYRSIFDDVYICDVPAPGTKILIALTRKEKIDRESLLERCREISAKHSFPYDLSTTIAGFRNSDTEQLRAAAVLKDSEILG